MSENGTSDKSALIVGLSGVSSSGKTTLARLLRDIFPSTFILHQDDFYKTDVDVPYFNGIQDWDCPESLEIPAMAKALAYIRQHAEIPSDLDSKEDQNSVGKCPIPESTVSALREKVAAAIPASHPLAQGKLRLCVLDGFLLFPPSMAAIQSSLDLKLLVRASHARALERRDARTGYVTVEGFWQDPPGYVDKVVWPRYVEQHSYLFEGGDVEGSYNYSVLSEQGIHVLPGAAVDADMDDTLNWMVDLILAEVLKR